MARVFTMYQVKEELRYTRLCQKEECLERPFSEATNKTFILVQNLPITRFDPVGQFLTKRIWYYKSFWRKSYLLRASKCSSTTTCKMGLIWYENLEMVPRLEKSSTCNSSEKVEIEYTSIHIVAAKIMSRFQRTTYYQHIFFFRFECISLWRS